MNWFTSAIEVMLCLIIFVTRLKLDVSVAVVFNALDVVCCNICNELCLHILCCFDGRCFQLVVSSTSLT